MQNNTSIYSDIKNYIKTIRELEDFSSEIDKILALIFKSSSESFDSASEEISEKTSDKIRELFLKNKIDSANKEAIKDFLTKLKESFEKFKTIKLTIAFDPSHQTIQKTYDWVFVNLGGDYVLDIEVNESILGGAIISFGGQYKDFSVKKDLSYLFQSRREEILQTK